MELKKTGNNKFAGYQYFELGDFLPQTQTIFNDLGLCGIVSFGETVATLKICDTESDNVIVIESPMKEANLKGCHPIQNLGAVETYTRRYLWVTAMEIVEHDAIDSSENSENPAQKAQPVKAGITDERLATAIEKIINGEYTKEKLKSSFALTQNQHDLLISKVGV